MRPLSSSALALAVLDEEAEPSVAIDETTANVRDLLDRNRTTSIDPQQTRTDNDREKPRFRDNIAQAVYDTLTSYFDANIRIEARAQIANQVSIKTEKNKGLSLAEQTTNLERVLEKIVPWSSYNIEEPEKQSYLIAVKVKLAQILKLDSITN